LPSNNRHKDKEDWWDRLTNYAIELNSGVMVRIPSFITMGLCLKCILGKNSDKRGKYGKLMSLLLLLIGIIKLR
jgi:hypothetical protein